MADCRAELWLLDQELAMLPRGTPDKVRMREQILYSLELHNNCRRDVCLLAVKKTPTTRFINKQQQQYFKHTPETTWTRLRTAAPAATSTPRSSPPGQTI